MIRLVQRCLRSDDDGAWIELREIFENESAHELRHILMQHGVAAEDADAVVVRYWQELAENKKSLWSFVGDSLRELKDWLVDTSVMFTLKLVEAGKVIVRGRDEPRSKKPRQLGIELLEPRMLMAADLLNFQLHHDTGAADQVTANPTVTAVVGSLQAGGAKVAVQLDHDGDQSPEATVEDLLAGDTVVYDPRLADPGFPQAGPVTLKHRGLELDAQDAVLSAGEWKSFNFEVGGSGTTVTSIWPTAPQSACPTPRPTKKRIRNTARKRNVRSFQCSTNRW